MSLLRHLKFTSNSPVQVSNGNSPPSSTALSSWVRRDAFLSNWQTLSTPFYNITKTWRTKAESTLPKHGGRRRSQYYQNMEGEVNITKTWRTKAESTLSKRGGRRRSQHYQNMEDEGGANITKTREGQGGVNINKTWRAKAEPILPKHGGRRRSQHYQDMEGEGGVNITITIILRSGRVKLAPDIVNFYANPALPATLPRLQLCCYGIVGITGYIITHYNTKKPTNLSICDSVATEILTSSGQIYQRRRHDTIQWSTKACLLNLAIYFM